LGKYGRETYCDEHDAGTNANLTLLAKNHRQRHNIQLPRQRLRALLLRELREGTIEWGMKFQSYTKIGDEYCIQFIQKNNHNAVEDENRVQISGAIAIIGADGIYSNVYAQKFLGIGNNNKQTTLIPNNNLSYLGVVVILGISLYEDNRLVRRVTQTLDGETRIYTMPFISEEDIDDTQAASKFPIGHNLSMWQLSFPVSLEEAMKLHKSGGKGLKQEALRRCGKWHDPIPQLIIATNEEDITGYPAFDRDVMDFNEFRQGKSKENDDNRVTVIGDACHPMSPFKGQGANQALVDAVTLAKHIGKAYNHHDDDAQSMMNNYGEFNLKQLEYELGNFEQDMLTRAKDKVEGSRTASKFLHSTKALTPGNCVRSESMFQRIQNNGVDKVLAPKDRVVIRDKGEVFT
jgi:salicylate hydroxylase